MTFVEWHVPLGKNAQFLKTAEIAFVRRKMSSVKKNLVNSQTKEAEEAVKRSIGRNRKVIIFQRVTDYCIFT